MAVHGYAIGHALGTALFCDLVAAAEDARFQVWPAPDGRDQGAGHAVDGGNEAR